MSHTGQGAGQLESIRWRFPQVHPAGRVFVAIAALLAVVVTALGWRAAGWSLPNLLLGAAATLLTGLAVWTAAFFRDPIRAVPQDPALVIAPADGLVTLIRELPAPAELAAVLGPGRFTRVSIFMSVFDVHIQRAPVAGRIVHLDYVPGRFVNADLDKASEHNERQHFVVERGDGVRIGFTQIAGLVARRILAFRRAGDAVAVGERVGLIRFGSRVDVFLPAGTAPLVAIGQRAIAGETVLASLGAARPAVAVAS